jgi:hypothetical protein
MVTAMLDILGKLLMAVLLLAWAVRRARNNRRLRVHEQGRRYAANCAVLFREKDQWRNRLANSSG